MANNNTLTLIGNLGKDPQQYTKDGKSFTRLSIATTDSYKDSKTGAWMKRKPIWHTVFVNFDKAQVSALSFKKGDRIRIVGSLSYRHIKTSDKGHTATFTETSIRAHRVEAAPLPNKSEDEAAA